MAPVGSPVKFSKYLDDRTTKAWLGHHNMHVIDTGKSKEENPLVAEMLKNIEKLKADQVELVKKIKALEEKIKNAEEN